MMASLRHGLVLVLALMALTGVSASGARAQGPVADPPPPAEAVDMEKAKELFLEGAAAAEGQRWQEASNLFLRSYELSHRESALLNYAVSLKELSRFVEARDAFDKLLREHQPPPEMAEKARVMRDEAAGKVAVLDLRGMDRDVTHEILVNGVAVPDEQQRPMRVDENPGPLRLRVTMPDSDEVFSWEGQAAAGERVLVDVQFEDRDTSSIFESPLFWIVTGAVVVAGAAVGVYFILDSNADLSPGSSNTVRLL